MSEATPNRAQPNRSTPTLRWDLAEWIEQNLPDALWALDTEEPELFLGGIPDFDVKPHRSRLSEGLERYLIDIRLEQCARGVRAGNARSHVVTIHVVAPRDDVEATPELDGMVSALLDAFTTVSKGLNWTSAEYVIRDESFPAYQITLNLEDAK